MKIDVPNNSTADCRYEEKNKGTIPIKIISDGIGWHTKVIHAETGELIENCYKVEWSADCDGLANAKLYFRMIPVEITCLGEEWRKYR